MAGAKDAPLTKKIKFKFIATSLTPTIPIFGNNGIAIE